MSVAYDAMMFAYAVHATQVRKYTGDPYVIHLGEVAGIVSTVLDGMDPYDRDIALACAWLHDCVEDQNVDYETLENRFGFWVSRGVWYLSDTEKGNRKVRKELSRTRLSCAPDYIQSIKVADGISNLKSIVTHDPKFAIVYTDEHNRLLDALTRADDRLKELFRSQIAEAILNPSVWNCRRF